MAARLTRPLNRGTDWEVRWRSGHMDKGLDKAAPSDPNVLLFSELRCRPGRSEAPMCVPLSHRHEPTELMF